eukprot:RCo021038
MHVSLRAMTHSTSGHCTVDTAGEGFPTTITPTKHRSSVVWGAAWADSLHGSPVLGAFNIICCVVGVGLLGLPYAVSRSGWIGIPLLLLTCWMASYTAVLLGECLAAVPGVKSFGDLGEAAYGARGRYAVVVQQYMTMLGVASIFLVVLASGLREVLPSLFPNCRSNIVASTVMVLFHVGFYKMGEVGLLSGLNLLVAIVLTLVICREVLASAPAVRPPTVFLNTARGSSGLSHEFWAAFPTLAFAFGCHTILPAVHEQLSAKPAYRGLCWAAIPA